MSNATSVDASAVSLSFLESAWDSYYARFDNRAIATGVLLLSVHELVYFGRSLPWLLVDMIPYFRRWKIQDTRIPTSKDYWQCLRSVMLAHMFIEAVPIFGFYPVCQLAGIATTTPFPSYSTVLLQLAAFFVMEDTWHYWGHRLLHHPYLYKRVHKQHHKYAAPFGLTAEYAHPIEVAFTGTGTVGSPVLWAALFGNVHLVTVMLWITLRLMQAIDSHSGYEFPWSLHHIIPFWSGADHHDDHHKYFTGNYASSFRWWDYCLGTETEATSKRRTTINKQKLS